jgi:bifunctional DNA-binding transcriptional regulator/antitoxin component of YhaV-PrlF toxin-antitoxin module
VEVPSKLRRVLGLAREDIVFVVGISHTIVFSINKLYPAEPK